MRLHWGILTYSLNYFLVGVFLVQGWHAIGGYDLFLRPVFVEKLLNLDLT